MTTKSEKPLGGHGTDTTTTKERKPIGLLDLPLDILQAICREFTHTNDFTAVALTHSALYDLVIPQIYSRFDIVWPDASPTAESRMGVDALTYGLATLVMAHDVFGEAQYQQVKYTCQNCGHHNGCKHQQTNPRKPRRIRRGNYYAQYTKKFSLGNGPADWVREYLITKEGGKMLGTLVALAVGRMRNLETFTWDMPTGVLRDVWLALASLADRGDDQSCKLEKVWVRWHDNSENMPVPATSSVPGALSIQSTDLPSLLTTTASSFFQIPPYPRVEFPTFSILPPLKSLNVLDIDELSYVEEMSILIEGSLDRLRELRVGVARHAMFDLWARPQEAGNIQPPSLMDLSQPVSRPGGLLGILVHRFCSISNSSIPTSHYDTASTESLTIVNQSEQLQSNQRTSSVTKLEEQDQNEPVNIDQLTSLLSAQHIEDMANNNHPSPAIGVQKSHHLSTSSSTVSNGNAESFGDHSKDVQVKRLRLEVLELERIYLSIPILSRAFDWTKLVSLTLLGCRNHDQLWKALRRKFTPVGHHRSSSLTMATTTSNSLPSQRCASGPLPTPVPASDYRLRITKIHTDTVSNAFLTFVKEALAPDSLEWLFLQQNETWKTSVTIEQIYKYAIRPHRSSIKNLLIDSDVKLGPDSPTPSWRRWAFSKDLITCITSGRMKLRELSMAIDYKDWHYFLQRLPNASTLRSVHITHVADHINGRFDSRDTAQQILDVVALRPELEICYVAIQSKCFEILELPKNRCPSPIPLLNSNTTVAQQIIDDDDDDDLSDEHDDHNDDEDDESDTNSEQDNGFDTSEDEDTGNGEGDQSPTYRLREILFYDDRISIFKARHGKL